MHKTDTLNEKNIALENQLVNDLDTNLNSNPNTNNNEIALTQTEIEDNAVSLSVDTLTLPKPQNRFFRALAKLVALKNYIYKRPWLVLVIMGGILLALMSLFMFVNVGISFTRTMWDRFPMLIAMLLIAIAVGYSTVAFQTVTGARILTPGVLGFENVYMFLQTILLVIGTALPALVEIPFFREINFAFSLVIMVVFSLFVFMPLFTKGSKGIYVLLLVGIILSTLFAALTSFMQFFMDPDIFATAQGIMFASFVAPDFLLMIVGGVIMVGSFFIAPPLRSLDVISLGRDNAISLGINHKVVALRILVVVAILVSVSTVIVGPVMFLGLISANLAYQFIKTYKHKFTMPAAVLISAIALVAAEFIIRELIPFEINVAIFINFFGGIYFIFLLLRERKKDK